MSTFYERFVEDARAKWLNSFVEYKADRIARKAKDVGVEFQRLVESLDRDPGILRLQLEELSEDVIDLLVLLRNARDAIEDAITSQSYD